MVFFESPHRLADALADAAAAFGAERPAAVCRELTKTYEEIRRGPLAELAAWAADGVRGEITLVVAGAPERVAELDAGELAAAVAAEEAAGADPQGRHPRRRRPHRPAPADRLRRRRRRQGPLSAAARRSTRRPVRPTPNGHERSPPCWSPTASAPSNVTTAGRSPPGDDLAPSGGGRCLRGCDPPARRPGWSTGTSPPTARRPSRSSTGTPCPATSPTACAPWASRSGACRWCPRAASPT